MRASLRTLLPSLLLVSSASAAGELSIRADRAFDGGGKVIAPARIVVDNGRIVRVEQSADGADVELPGCTLLPGLIDTHVHLAWHFDADGRSHDDEERGESRAQTALYTFENATATLLGGVTTVQSLGAPVDALVRDAVARGGFPGPRVLTSLEPLWDESVPPAKLRELVAERAAQGADVIKVFASKSIRDGGAATFSQEQLDAVCGEARGRGLRVAVHAHGIESARRAARAGCSSIEHGVLLDAATLRFLAERQVTFDPNIHLIFRNYFENRAHFLGTGNFTEEGFRQMEAAVPKAHAIFRQALATPGLRVVFGTDAVAGSHGRNVEELIDRVLSGGQSPADALTSATSLAAASLDLDKETGALAPGLAADVIAVEGDPTNDITTLRRVAFVMRAGSIWKEPARNKSNDVP